MAASTSSAVLMIALIAMSAAACTPKQTSGNRQIARDQEELAGLERKREDRSGELRKMDIARLAQELTADTKRGVEPFNSMAFREVVSRGSAAASSLRAAVMPEASSLLTLLALRQVGADEYRGIPQSVRARVLADALAQSRFFNTWGIPHLFWEEPGKAVIEEGRAMEAPLIALLDDKREARIWGSEGSLEQQRYHYRVCDYAWALLNEVRGQKIAIPENPGERDRLIEAAKKGPPV
jgi:hypothetical protein